MSRTIRVDDHVGTTILRGRLVLERQNPGRRITQNEAVRTLLAVASLHRVALMPTPTRAECDPVDPPCERVDA